MNAEYLHEFMNGPADIFEKSDWLVGFKHRGKYSERQIAKVTGISKSQIHRNLSLKDIPETIRECVRKYQIDLYICFKWLESQGQVRQILEDKILDGQIVTHQQAVRFLRSILGPAQTKRTSAATEFKIKKRITELEKELHRLKAKVNQEATA